MPVLRVAAALAFLLPAVALAAPPVALKPMLPIAKTIAAFPRLQGGGPAAERINAALAALDARVRKAAKEDCTDWSRSIAVPMQGPHYLAFFVSDELDCGAHPDEGQMALVYDLGSGRPVNWQRLLPPALAGKAVLDSAEDGTRIGELVSPALTALYLKAAPPPDADCKEALTSGPLQFQLWPDAETGGLAIMPSNLPHVVQACANTATFAPAKLKQMGADPALAAAIAEAHAKGWYAKDAAQQPR